MTDNPTAFDKATGDGDAGTLLPHEVLAYQADGLAMCSRLFRTGGNADQPGVLVFPEAFGLNDHTVERAMRLARLGYAALACDLHGDGHVEDDPQRATALLEPLLADPAKTRARAAAALHALTSCSGVDATRVAAIGFCFGGTMALELARSGANIAATVGFHSGLGTVSAPVGRSVLKGSVLVCIGADDPVIPAAQRAVFEAEMREAGADWQMHVYGGTVHSFTNRGASKYQMESVVRYNEAADRRSWASMLALFDERLRRRETADE